MAIYFCHDGILRTHDQDHKCMFSLSFVQQEQELDDFNFWVNWWNCPVFFEKGLTLGQFFKCLDPWKQFWGTYLRKDLAAYIQEVKKPIAVDQLTHYDWIELSYQTELSPAIIYKEDTSLIQEHWNMDHFYQSHAYHLGDHHPHHIYYQALNTIAHTPLILNSYQIIRADHFLLSNYQVHCLPLFNLKSHGVITENQYSSHYIRCVKQHLLKDLLEGFFERFDSTPEQRDSYNTTIRQTIEDTIAQSSFNIPDNQLYLLDDIIMEDREFLSSTSHDLSYYTSQAMKHTQESHFVLGKFHPGKPLEKRINNQIIQEDH